MTMTAEEFRKLRMRCGLEVKEAAYIAGYGYSTWRGFENGFQPVSPKAEVWLRDFFARQELQLAYDALEKEVKVLRKRLGITGSLQEKTDFDRIMDRRRSQA